MSNPQSSVLVAEDDARMMRLMQRNLELAQYRVVTAPDGIAALDLIETKPCDLLLLDIMMPKMDGLEVCRRVRERLRRETPRRPGFKIAVRDRTSKVERVIYATGRPLRKRAKEGKAEVRGQRSEVS